MTEKVPPYERKTEPGIRSSNMLFRTRPAFILTLLGLLTLCGQASPSAAQTAREFAREGFAAKDRQQYPLAIRLFGEALKQGQFTSEQRGFILYGRGVSFEAMGLRDLALGDLDAAIRAPA